MELQIVSNDPGVVGAYDKFILVIDDELDVAIIIKKFLYNNGFDVFAFTDPHMALEHFNINKNKYSIIISDIRMPLMSGFEFVKEIRKISPSVKIMLMSAFEINQVDFKNMLSSVEISGFIQKPVTQNELIDIIKKQLSSP